MSVLSIFATEDNLIEFCLVTFWLFFWILLFLFLDTLSDFSDPSIVLAGFIKTEINEDGEKTLVPVSEQWLVEPQSQNIYDMTNALLLENRASLGICM